MTTGKDSILEVLRLGNLRFWKLRNLQESNLMAVSPEDESATIDGSIALFEKHIDLLGPGQYCVEAWEKQGQVKERKKIKFEIPATTGVGIGGLGIQIPAGVSPEEIQGKIDKALEEYKVKEELQKLRDENVELKRQNKELSENNNNPLNRIIGKLEPFVDPFIKASGLVKPAEIAGTPTTTSSDEYQKRLEIAFDEWLEVEQGSEVIRLVEAIAKLAKEKDPKYNLAKQMI